MCSLYAAERVSESSLWRTNWIHSSRHLCHRQEHHPYGLTIISCTLLGYRPVLAATLRWFTAGGVIRIAVSYDNFRKRGNYVIDDVITRKL